MKKILAALVLALLFTGVIGCANSNADLEEYCYKVNERIKDTEFFTAKISGDKVILYADDGEETGKIDISDADGSIGKKIKYIRKENNNVYFITSRVVDDETGIMFINDNSNKALDGIKKAERIGGNSYSYSSN